MPALIPDAWPYIAGEPDLDVLPRRLTKKTAAAVVTKHKFPVTPRALQDWIVVNAKATCATEQLLAAADRRLAEGRRRSAVIVAQPASTRPTSDRTSLPAAAKRRASAQTSAA
jgi:hypothetical protein